MFKLKNTPTTPEEVTAVWLTNALAHSGTLMETAVANVNCTSMNGAGYAGQVARLTLSYDELVENAPTSLIAKFSNPDPTIREALHDLYVREVRIYQEMIDEISLAVPQCYYSDVDEESGHAILLLEDLAHLRTGDIAQGCSIEDAETVVTNFAKHHAQWWQNPLLDEIDYLRYELTVDPEWATTYRDWWSQFEQIVTTLLPDCFIPSSLLDVGHQSSCQLQEVNNLWKNTPFTLMHKDTHLDNLMFANDKNDPSLTVIDWQLCGSGPGVSDITYFLIFSMPVLLRRQSEVRLLKLYHATLLANGVTNYCFEQCWHDYRLAFFRNLRTAVVVVNILDITRPHAHNFIQAMIARLSSFAEDHQVSEFL